MYPTFSVPTINLTHKILSSIITLQQKWAIVPKSSEDKQLRHWILVLGEEKKILSKGVDSVPASKPVHITFLFHTSLKTGHVLAIPGNFRQYKLVPSILASTEKSFFFFFF